MRPQDYYAPFKSAENKENYVETRGIKRISNLYDLQFFNIMDSMTFDGFHDLEEGVIPLVFQLIFVYFSSNRIITKEMIVTRAKEFSYGVLDSHYAPKGLTTDFSSIKLSGIQSRNLLFRFIFIYGDLENEENGKIFNIVRNLIMITKTVYSYQHSEANVVALELAIKTFLVDIKTVFKLHRTPKMHFLIHYPNMIRRLGPPIIHATMCFENRHHPFNAKAHTFTNFSTLHTTLSKFNQQYFAQTWSNLTEMVEVTISKDADLDSTVQESLEVEDDIRQLKFIKGQVEIRPGFYIIKENEMSFYKVEHVIKIKGKV